jgi:hypothetical protein
LLLQPGHATRPIIHSDRAGSASCPVVLMYSVVERMR